MAEVEKTNFISMETAYQSAYWERVKNHSKLHLIFREVPHTVFGTRVNDLSHVSDIWRVNFIIKYG